MDKNNQKLLVIGHVWPQPNATAAGQHILHLLLFFKKLKYSIHFVSASQQPKNYNTLNDITIKNTIVTINDNNFDKLLTNFNPNIVLFDRFMVEEQFSWRIYKTCPNAIRILDTEDLHFLRKERQQNLTNNNDKDIPEITKREIASIYRSDFSLIISETEKKLLQDKYQLPEELLHYTPLLIDSIKTPKNPTFNERKDLIFIGNFLHEPNWSCVQILKKEIWPKLSKKLPGVNLHIYGSHATSKNLQLHNPKQRFFVHGYVENSTNIITNSKLMIAPIPFGAGQKGKFLDAMQCGTPSITTPIGAEGMHFNKPWPGAITCTNTEFIEQTVLIYKNELLWNKAQQNAQQLLPHFLFEQHFQHFKTKLYELQNNITTYRKKNIVGSILWHQNFRSTEYMSRWIMEKNNIPK